MRLTTSHCLSFLTEFPSHVEGYGREWTSAKHKVDSYSTDWRKLICTYAPVAPTYKTYSTFFVTSPTRENSIGGATKWWGALRNTSYFQQFPRCLPCFPHCHKCSNPTKTAIHNRIHSYLCVQERG